MATRIRSGAAGALALVVARVPPAARSIRAACALEFASGPRFYCLNSGLVEAYTDEDR